VRDDQLWGVIHNIIFRESPYLDENEIDELTDLITVAVREWIVESVLEI